MFVRHPYDKSTYKRPQVTRAELAYILDWYRRRKKECANPPGWWPKISGRSTFNPEWLCDVWQDAISRRGGWGHIKILDAGIAYMLSRPRLRRQYDLPYQAETPHIGASTGDCPVLMK